MVCPKSGVVVDGPKNKGIDVVVKPPIEDHVTIRLRSAVEISDDKKFTVFGIDIDEFNIQ